MTTAVVSIEGDLLTATFHTALGRHLTVEWRMGDDPVLDRFVSTLRDILETSAQTVMLNLMGGDVVPDSPQGLTPDNMACRICDRKPELDQTAGWFFDARSGRAYCPDHYPADR